jgi:hypothetical protein
MHSSGGHPVESLSIEELEMLAAAIRPGLQDDMIAGARALS